MLIRQKFLSLALLILLALVASCAQSSRYGMVLDQNTGLQYGSVVENNLVVDAEQFDNHNLKLKIRNTSGDPIFDLDNFKHHLLSEYRKKGYESNPNEPYGIVLDVNVVYSGQVTQNMALQYGLLGGAAGGIIGSRSNAQSGTAIGVVTGLTIGSILGSYHQDQTYVVVVEVTLGIFDEIRGRMNEKIIFGTDKEIERSERTGRRPFEEYLESGIAVYAGGRNINQFVIADGVRTRMTKILEDII